MSGPAWQTDELGEEWVESTSPDHLTAQMPPPTTSINLDSVKAKRGSLRSLGQGSARALPPSRSASNDTNTRIVSGHGRGARSLVPSGEFLVPSPNEGLPSPPSSRSSSGTGTAAAPPDAAAGTCVVKEGVDDDRGKALAKIAGAKGNIFGKNRLERMFEPPSPPSQGEPNRVEPMPEETPEEALEGHRDEPRRASHPYAPARPSRLSKSMTPSTVTSSADMSSATAAEGWDQSGRIGGELEDLAGGHDDQRGTNEKRSAGEHDGRHPPLDDFAPNNLTLQSGEIETDLSPFARPNHPFTFVAPVRTTSATSGSGTGSGSATIRGGSVRSRFDPPFDALPGGEPSHSTIPQSRRQPHRQRREPRSPCNPHARSSRPHHDVRTSGPTQNARPGLRLFRGTYDTYTREHLSAMLDSIAVESSPSPSRSNDEHSVRTSGEDAQSSPSAGTSSSAESRSSKRLRLSPPSPRRAPRDWGAQGRAMMDRIRVRAEESTTSSQSKGSGDDHADSAASLGISPSPSIEAFLLVQPDKLTHRSNPSTASSGYLRAAEDVMAKIRARAVSDSASGFDSSPNGKRIPLSEVGEDNIWTRSAGLEKGKGKARNGSSPRRMLRRLSASEEIKRATEDDSDEPQISPTEFRPPSLENRRPTSAASGSTDGAPRPPLDAAKADDLNRFVSATTVTTTTTMSTAFVKHAGPRTGKGMRMIRPDEVTSLVPERVGKMVFDKLEMRWVREGAGLGRVSEAGESRAGGSEESVDVFAGMESGEERAEAVEMEGEMTSESGGEEDGMADQTHHDLTDALLDTDMSESDEDVGGAESAPLLQQMIDPSPPVRPIPIHAYSAPPILTRRPAAGVSRPIRSALRNANSAGHGTGPKKRTGFHAELTPAPGRAGTDPLSSGKRSVSFSDGRKSGKIRDAELGGGEGSLFDRNGMQPSLRTRRIQEVLVDMEELSLDETTPSKPSRNPEPIRSPPEDVLTADPEPISEDDTIPIAPFRSNGSRPSRNAADATFLTECSFGVAHDKLVGLITDVQPFEPYWEELRSLNMRAKGAESVARLKEFLPRLEEVNLDDNRISYLSGIPSSVRTLHVAGNRLTSLTSVGHLLNLHYLDISRNQLDSVSQLSCLVHLRELILDDNKIADLSPLHDVDGLTRLSAKGNRIEKIDLGGAKWKQFEVLDVAENRISEVEGLEGLVSLRELNLDGNELTSFTTSSTLPSLRTLRLSNNDLSSLNLSHFPKLRTLYADENRLRTLQRSNRGGKSRLEALSLRSQRVKGLELSSWEWAGLKRFYFSGNDLSSSFFPNTPVPSLQYIEAAACRMTSLPSRLCERMPNLKVLNINYNFLEHLDGLGGMVGLQKVMIVGNRLGGNGGAVLSGLKGLNGLEEIDLRMNPSTLGFYLPLFPSTSRPLVDAAELAQNANKTAILLGRANATQATIGSTSLPHHAEASGDWASQDRRYRKNLPDEWYTKRLAYRGMVMALCVRVRVLDGLEVGEGERWKAGELLRGSGRG